MLSKCCTQYVSKSGKPTNGHSTGKGQSSSQFQRRAVLMNCLAVQTTSQLHSSPVLVRLCSKSCMLGFSITWTENLQMSKLGLEKAEEPEIKLPTFAGSQRKQGNSWKTSTSISWTMLLIVWIVTNWKTLKEMEIPGHLTCFLWNLYAGQEATVRSLYGTIDCFRIEKGAWQGCLSSPCLFNFHAEYIMRIAGLDELQAEIKTARRNSNNLRYTNDTALMAESKEELKNLLMRVKEGSEKVGSKLNIKKLTSWHLAPSLHGK